MPDTVLNGSVCSATLTSEAVTVSGEYYRYDLHKRVKVSGRVTVDLLNVLRVGITKTYSRLMFAFPMGFGFAALFIKSIPSAGYSITIIPDIWELELFSLWSMPFQDFLWKLCAILCLLTTPLYWLSYRNDLEINTTQGRYLLPRKGMEGAHIARFQQEFTKLKAERRKQ